jgi:glycine hydroxymethyltransferase
LSGRTPQQREFLIECFKVSSRISDRFLDVWANQTIAGIAVALKQAADPAFKAYAKQVIANAKTIAKVLSSHDYKLQTDGTDNHLVLWDLRPLGLTGSKIEKICDEAHITV